MQHTVQLVLGAVMVVAGLVPAVLPRATAATSEILDAIGSKTPASEVEPAEWKVTWTRLSGIAVVVLGLFLVAAALSPRF
ncbi:hypothetical protein [Haloglomus litoreum]|uniref:hypothetical protein n=1 Tax=Haloglomus litoreum TaxID=3034026 RepID=UPI0023E759C0|nr:hypothetical protein [Haloglomus sp. DT116]